MSNTIVRKLVTTSNEGALWCGTEVEAYWICDGPRGTKKSIYVRAHATRLTALREQLNRGRRVEPPTVKAAKELVKLWHAEFVTWESARRTNLDKIQEPWTDSERRILDAVERSEDESVTHAWGTC